mmetsp:Transcript_10475/g.30834  ORF Transcript_10475/g.30834 Transcript_10475/m.30834 type:complete len:105 (-) Transcript_10475:350-664(-)
MLPGGLLTGYIGISVEKVLFVLLASGALGRREHVRSAAITSVTFVGWLSGVSLAVRASRAGTASPDARDYVGEVPWRLVATALPGVVLGTMLGPRVNRWVPLPA